ncbi:E3 ubiquitin-protein ligase TRIM71-like [Mercenaria mercenaria]|uniref:E3 ubiquitin-protein ligase TRIM71-like n=1 Tax=Mercenaria mercenaria TaxID=6596 RepID=UPI00234F42A3|nr:E3 ubiquitin-protein ligase TRIM71-like [Mercenaria mercenaria]
MAVSGKKTQTKFSPMISLGSDEDFETFCQPCDQDDLRLPAFGFCMDCEEHLCESCFTHHRRARPSRHHSLLDKHNMPHTLQVPSKSVHTAQSDDLSTPCAKHKKEMIKFYCHDHKALVCSVCVTLEHTGTSCHVNYIPDISTQCLNSKEYTSTLKEMDIITQKLQKTTADLTEKITSSNNILEDILADIKKFRNEINQRLDELEKQAFDKARALQRDNEGRLKTVETANITKLLKASADSIKHFNTSKQTDRLFMELKSAEKLIKDGQKKLSQLPSPDDVKEYFFQPNPKIFSFPFKEKSLGALKHYSWQGNICVKKAEDESSCWITGMTLLAPSKLLLTDLYNDSIKMVNVNNDSVTDELYLNTYPWDITPVTRGQVAVTLPAKDTIQYVSASSNKLLLKHKLDVDGECYGLSCYGDKLAVTFCCPGKLQIIDLKGKVQTTVATNSNGEDVFSKPDYVISNSHSIYASDREKHVVIRLNWQGELTGSYDAMGSPRGLALLEDDSIVACDAYNSNIQHISADLKKGHVVFKDVKYPQAIYLCGTNNKLYISRDSYDEKNKHLIRVFKML